MRNLDTWKLFAGSVLVVSVWAPAIVTAQDLLKVAPEAVKVLFENERVRAVDIRLKPGGKFGMHSHGQHVSVALSPCKVKYTLPDGKAREVETKAGDVNWGNPETHSSENIGAGECHGVDIELK